MLLCLVYPDFAGQISQKPFYMPHRTGIWLFFYKKRGRFPYLPSICPIPYKQTTVRTLYPHSSQEEKLPTGKQSKKRACQLKTEQEDTHPPKPSKRACQLKTAQEDTLRQKPSRNRTVHQKNRTPQTGRISLLFLNP